MFSEIIVIFVLGNGISPTICECLEVTADPNVFGSYDLIIIIYTCHKAWYDKGLAAGFIRKKTQKLNKTVKPKEREGNLGIFSSNRLLQEIQHTKFKQCTGTACMTSYSGHAEIWCCL